MEHIFGKQNTHYCNSYTQGNPEWENYVNKTNCKCCGQQSLACEQSMTKKIVQSLKVKIANLQNDPEQLKFAKRPIKKRQKEYYCLMLRKINTLDRKLQNLETLLKTHLTCATKFSANTYKRNCDNLEFFYSVQSLIDFSNKIKKDIMYKKHDINHRPNGKKNQNETQLGDRIDLLEATLLELSCFIEKLKDRTQPVYCPNQQLSQEQWHFPGETRSYMKTSYQKMSNKCQCCSQNVKSNNHFSKSLSRSFSTIPSDNQLTRPPSTNTSLCSCIIYKDNKGSRKPMKTNFTNSLRPTNKSLAFSFKNCTNHKKKPPPDHKQKPQFTNPPKVGHQICLHESDRENIQQLTPPKNLNSDNEHILIYNNNRPIGNGKKKRKHKGPNNEFYEVVENDNGEAPNTYPEKFKIESVSRVKSIHNMHAKEQHQQQSSKHLTRFRLNPNENVVKNVIYYGSIPKRNTNFNYKDKKSYQNMHTRKNSRQQNGGTINKNYFLKQVKMSSSSSNGKMHGNLENFGQHLINNRDYYNVASDSSKSSESEKLRIGQRNVGLVYLPLKTTSYSNFNMNIKKENDNSTSKHIHFKFFKEKNPKGNFDKPVNKLLEEKGDHYKAFYLCNLKRTDSKNENKCSYQQKYYRYPKSRAQHCNPNNCLTVSNKTEDLGRINSYNTPPHCRIHLCKKQKCVNNMSNNRSELVLLLNSNNTSSNCGDSNSTNSVGTTPEQVESSHKHNKLETRVCSKYTTKPRIMKAPPLKHFKNTRHTKITFEKENIKSCNIKDNMNNRMSEPTSWNSHYSRPKDVLKNRKKEGEGKEQTKIPNMHYKNNNTNNNILENGNYEKINYGSSSAGITQNRGKSNVGHTFPTKLEQDNTFHESNISDITFKTPAEPLSSDSNINNPGNKEINDFPLEIPDSRCNYVVSIGNLSKAYADQLNIKKVSVNQKNSESQTLVAQPIPSHTIIKNLDNPTEQRKKSTHTITKKQHLNLYNIYELSNSISNNSAGGSEENNPQTQVLNLNTIQSGLSLSNHERKQNSKGIITNKISNTVTIRNLSSASNKTQMNSCLDVNKEDSKLLKHVEQNTGVLFKSKSEILIPSNIKFPRNISISKYSKPAEELFMNRQLLSEYDLNQMQQTDKLELKNKKYIHSNQDSYTPMCIHRKCSAKNIKCEYRLPEQNEMEFYDNSLASIRSILSDSKSVMSQQCDECPKYSNTSCGTINVRRRWSKQIKRTQFLYKKYSGRFSNIRRTINKPKRETPFENCNKKSFSNSRFKVSKNEQYRSTLNPTTTSLSSFSTLNWENIARKLKEDMHDHHNT